MAGHTVQAEQVKAVLAPTGVPPTDAVSRGVAPRLREKHTESAQAQSDQVAAARVWVQLELYSGPLRLGLPLPLELAPRW